MLHQKNPRVAERGRLLAISRSFEFPFCFSEHAYTCIFFIRMRYKLIGKAFFEIRSRRVF